MLLGGVTMRTFNANFHTICISFAVMQSWYIWLSSEPVGKIATCFGRRIITLNRITAPLRSATRVSDDNCRKPQKTPRHNHDRPLSWWWHFCHFQSMAIFHFWRNREFTFFQRCLQPLYLSWSPSPTQSSLQFSTGIQFCQFCPHGQWWKKYSRKLPVCTSLKFKLQNYSSSWDFTFLLYKSSWAAEN